MTDAEIQLMEYHGWTFTDKSFIDGHGKYVEDWVANHPHLCGPLSLSQNIRNTPIEEFINIISDNGAPMYKEIPQEPEKLISTYLPFLTYLPETCDVKTDTIYAAITAIESGLEYARECLATHDADIGRTTRKNKTWAETMEHDILHMKQTLETLQSIIS